MPIVTKLWKDIAIGDTFLDGSKVLSIHESYKSECYRVSYKKFMKEYGTILSSTHLLLCDTSHLNDDVRKWVDDNFGNYCIPTLYDKHVYMENLDEKLNRISERPMTREEIFSILQESNEKTTLNLVESDKSKVSNDLYWLPVSAIFTIVRNFKGKILCNGHRLYCEYQGIKEVFCVQTDSHRFETNGLIHHNSVALRNIIFHCLTHNESIAIALIDLKVVEFEEYKGMKGVVAVANTVAEAAEIMRLSKEVMQKRNRELASLKLQNIADFKPQKPTDEVVVAGRKLNDGDEVDIKLTTGEIKRVTVKELEGYLQ